MEEKELSGQESLRLIESMIRTAKSEQKDNGKDWIIWGWMLFLASALTVANIYFSWFSPFFFWNAFGIVTIGVFIYEWYRSAFVKKTVRVKTYTAELYEKLNRGFFISLMFIIISINAGVLPRFGFALLINLYAFWILIYGSTMNFRPSLAGAYCTWVIGIIALFVPSFAWVMVMHGLAVVAGYIIPGHLANREFNKMKSKEKAIAGV